MKNLMLIFVAVLIAKASYSQCGASSTTGTTNNCFLNTSRQANINLANIDSIIAAKWYGSVIGSSYLQEADPAFVASAASGITGTNIFQWNSAYSWGNHSSAGYLAGNDTLSLSNRVNLKYTAPAGTTSQYVRGDGSLATFPTAGSVSSVEFSSPDMSVSGSPIVTSGIISATLTATGVTAGTYDWITVDAKGRATAGVNTPVPTTIAAGARNFNQAYQLSSTRPAFISISSSVSCNLSLTGGQAGNVQLQISPNGSSGWLTTGILPASNLGSLTIGLNTTQVSGGQLDVPLPAGYYWRAATTNTAGTPTYTFNGGYEITY